MPATHLVLLPSYNTGPRRLGAVVEEVLAHWPDVMVVVDGSTDGSAEAMTELARRRPALEVLVLAENSGKGAAVLAGAERARRRGFTHALVMDADGQHPAASIAEFMAVSQRAPEALVLGKPIFPPNIPRERLYGRQLSIGMVRLTLMGPGVADPLYGFRVYPIAPLLAELGPRRGGRRYDFDTEAAVRLAWAGVPPLNVPAPVKYFSAREGGVSHFHYVRDNVTLVGMHVRLLLELIFRRWPALLRHRRKWRRAGFVAGVLFVAAIGGLGGAATEARASAPADQEAAEGLVVAENQLAAGAWGDLREALGRTPAVTADFVERRRFPFKREPVTLAGEVRVSAERGLSLHYREPEARIVILDRAGVLVREAGGRTVPADPRAAAANQALLKLLHLDLDGLAADFELYGRRDGGAWSLALVSRTPALRRSVGTILASGEGATVRRIEIRRTEKQAIEIAIEAPRSTAAFTAEELKAFFR